MTRSGYVDGFNLALILNSTRELMSQKIFDLALKHSGLERYRETLPEWNTPNAASNQEITDFWLSLYKNVPAPTFKLFQRNVGSKMAEASQQLPSGQTARQVILALPKEQRLAQAVKSVSDTINQRGLPTLYRPYEKGFLLYFVHCPFICEELKQPEPICEVYEHMFLKVLKWHTQLPLMSKEVSCIATGQAECQYYFWEL